jgi:two-component system phosphate regulon sensor histidine kinase PhoR
MLSSGAFVMQASHALGMAGKTLGDAMTATALLFDLVQAVPMPMVAIGPDERLVAMNTAAGGLIDPAALGRHHAMGMRQPGLMQAVERALARGERAVVQPVSFGGAHESLWRVTVTPIEQSDGRGAVCVFEDLTEQEQIGQVRRDFVANVSHELRTPLTALIGFIETLRGPARDDAAARERFLDIMEREATRMTRLVRDLLSLSRVEAQERQRPTELVEVQSSIQGVLAILRQTIDEAQVKLVLDGCKEPVSVPADSDQLGQVWQNLIENAVKYGGAGKTVTVRVSTNDHDPLLRGPSVRVDVVDQGEGLDPVHIPRLTERFYRVDSHRSRRQGGTGLGLAIVKHIVNRHRGRLKIDSTPGKGSVFTVILPR